MPPQAQWNALGPAGQANARARLVAAHPATPQAEREARIRVAFESTYFTPVINILRPILPKLVFRVGTAAEATGAPDAPNVAVQQLILGNAQLNAQITRILNTPFPETRPQGANLSARNVPANTLPFANPETILNFLVCFYGTKVTKDCEIIMGIPTWFYYYELKENAVITASACYLQVLNGILGLANIAPINPDDRNLCNELAALHIAQMPAGGSAALPPPPPPPGPLQPVGGGAALPPPPPPAGAAREVASTALDNYLNRQDVDDTFESLPAGPNREALLEAIEDFQEAHGRGLPTAALRQNVRLALGNAFPGGVPLRIRLPPAAQAGGRRTRGHKNRRRRATRRH